MVLLVNSDLEKIRMELLRNEKYLDRDFVMSNKDAVAKLSSLLSTSYFSILEFCNIYDHHVFVD